MPNEDFPTTKLTVDVGHQQASFCIGDFLNAVDDVTAYFESQRGADTSDLIVALRMYACVRETKE